MVGADMREDGLVRTRPQQVQVQNRTKAVMGLCTCSQSNILGTASVRGIIDSCIAFLCTVFLKKIASTIIAIS